MANQTITQLPSAGPITGTELVPIVQNGGTFKTTAAALAGSPVQTQTFLTLNQEPTLNNSRFLSSGTGVGLVDGGAQSFYRITLNGVSGSLEAMGAGFGVKAAGVMTARSITASGAGLSISNGDGQAGNPVASLTGTVASLANAGGTGFLALPGNGTVSGRILNGTADQVSVANGDGVGGNPEIGLAANPVLPGTESVTLPTGDSSERPASPVDGQIRFNSQTSRFEGYQGGNWVNVGTGDGSVASVAGTVNQIDVVDGSNNAVVSLADNPIIPGAGAIKLPAGITGDRPIAPINGMFRYNTTAAQFEGYANNAWGAIVTGGSGVTSIDVSGGTTGLTTSGGPVTSTGTITLSGVLGTANGGTGLSSYTAGDTLFYNADNVLNKLAIGAAGYIMTSSGTAPTWTNPSSITVNAATNLAGGALGSIPYQSNTGATTFLASGSGVLVNAGGNPSYSLTPSGLTSVTVTQDPVSALQLTTKQYVDTLAASGIHFHQPVRVESPINLVATYNNGTAGVGATLTNSGTQAALVIDGVAVSVADRVLIYQQTDQTQNGIYVVTDIGSVSTNWILTRSSDANTYVINSANGLSEGSTVFVQQGTTGAGETYTCNTSGVITFGTTNITFTQISATQIYSAGTGLTLTGTQFSLTNTAVAAGTYGSASAVPVFIVNAQGQLTNVVDTAIAITGAQVSGNIAGSAGSVANALTAGTYLTSTGTFDGSFARTFAVDATSANTADKIVARDASGNFSAGTITASLSGNATTATSATDATNAVNVGTTATATNADFFIPFVAASTTGNQALGVDAGITYNPSTNALTASINGGTF